MKFKAFDKNAKHKHTDTRHIMHISLKLWHRGIERNKNFLQ